MQHPGFLIIIFQELSSEMSDVMVMMTFYYFTAFFFIHLYFKEISGRAEVECIYTYSSRIIYIRALYILKRMLFFKRVNVYNSSSSSAFVSITDQALNKQNFYGTFIH